MTEDAKTPVTENTFDNEGAGKALFNFKLQKAVEDIIGAREALIRSFRLA